MIDQIMIKLLLSIAVLFLSVFSISFWLSIPLIIQVIIDKVIVQNSPEELSILSLYLLILSLLASALEIAISTFTTTFIRKGLVNESFVGIVTTLPPVVVMGIVMNVYSPMLAGGCLILNLFFCGTYYFLFRGQSRSNNLLSKPLPLSFRLPLTLIFIFVVWSGSQLVLKQELSLGQLIAFNIFSIYLSSSMLNLITVLTARKRQS